MSACLSVAHILWYSCAPNEPTKKKSSFKHALNSAVSIQYNTIIDWNISSLCFLWRLRANTGSCASQTQNVYIYFVFFLSLQSFANSCSRSSAKNRNSVVAAPRYLWISYVYMIFVVTHFCCSFFSLLFFYFSFVTICSVFLFQLRCRCFVVVLCGASTSTFHCIAKRLGEWKLTSTSVMIFAYVNCVQFHQRRMCTAEATLCLTHTAECSLDSNCYFSPDHPNAPSHCIVHRCKW